MTPITHATIVIERTYKATPARVFRAWEDKEARERWQTPDPSIQIRFEESDFREGGRDVSRCIEKDVVDFVATVFYLDIRPNESIVFTESVAQGDANVSAALISVEFAPASEGTRLLVTMQIAALGGSEMEKGYQFGWNAALDNLAKEFAQ